MSINSKRVIASIEARMTSSRLPGKILLPCHGKPMLEQMVNRLRRSRYIDEIVIATTTNATDDVVIELTQRVGVRAYRGSEHDVVGRVTGAMHEAHAEIVVQLTGDCPLIDPEIIDRLVRLYEGNDFDYVTNALVRSFPKGLDVQIASFKILERSYDLCQSDEDREHLFFTIRKHAEQFRLFNLLAEPDLCWPQWRWTLDTKEDYQFICRVYDSLYPINAKFGSRDIASWVLTQEGQGY